MEHTVLRMLGQSRRLQCPSLGVLSPLKEGGEGERERQGKGRNEGSRVVREWMRSREKEKRRSRKGREQEGEGGKR